MTSSTERSAVGRVSSDGEFELPEPLREAVGIDTPDEVYVYEEDGRIVVEPLPSLEDLHGVHAGEHEPGEVLAILREVDDE